MRDPAQMPHGDCSIPVLLSVLSSFQRALYKGERCLAVVAAAEAAVCGAGAGSTSATASAGAGAGAVSEMSNAPRSSHTSLKVTNCLTACSDHSPTLLHLSSECMFPLLHHCFTDKFHTQHHPPRHACVGVDIVPSSSECWTV